MHCGHARAPRGHALRRFPGSGRNPLLRQFYRPTLSRGGGASRTGGVSLR